MSSYRVVPYTPDRLADLEPLWAEYLEGEGAVAARRLRFRWLTEENPSLDGDPAYYLLLDGDRVVGMHGHMPQTFSVEGKRERFYLAQDDLLAAECRGKGLGKVMLQGVAEQQPSFAGALWHNPPNRGLYTKCGWTDLSELVYPLLLIDPKAFVRRKLGANPVSDALAFVGKGALAVQRSLRRAGRSKAYSIREIERFDETFDELYERAAPSCGVSVRRDAAYLNWKFVAKPENHYLRLAALDAQGTLRAYAVFSREGEGDDAVGRVIDVFGDPEHRDALDRVVREGVDRLQKMGVHSISSVGSRRAVGFLSRLGFIVRPVESGFMFVNWASRFDRDFVSNIENWYITASDADGDVWRES